MKFLLRHWGLILSGLLSFRVISVHGLSCYECTGEENEEFCNTTASVKSCPPEQDVCISQKVFNERDSTIISTKGCHNYTACQEKERENDAGCGQGQVQGRCTLCCWTNLCNYDRISQPQTTTKPEETMTLSSIRIVQESSGGEQCPTSDEATKRCLSQVRSGVASVIRGEENSFSNFCRSIPEIFRCLIDVTNSCGVTSGQSGGALCPLWEELRRICPLSCNETAAKNCVVEVLEGIVTKFTYRSSAVCEELTSEIQSAYECVLHSVSSCKESREIALKYSSLLSQLESNFSMICQRLPSIDSSDEDPVLVNRVGLAPCQLRIAMSCLLSVGEEIIDTRLEDKSVENVCKSLESSLSCVRSKTESCPLVLRKRALLLTEVVEGFLGNKVCDSVPINPVRCNTTAARLCIVDLLRLTKGRDIQEACNLVEETKSCVRWKTEKCTEEERDSLNRTLSHVLLSVDSHCSKDHFKCLSNETITLREGGEPKVIKVQVTHSPKTICSTPGCQVFLDILPDNRQAPNCRSKIPISQFVVSSGGEAGVGGGGGGGSMPFDLCSRLVTKDSWREEQLFYLAAKTDFKYDNSQLRSVRIAMRKVVNGTLLERRTICEHKVIVLDGDKQSVCQSVGDPHIQTFDGRAYNNFLEGFFTLFRHRSFPYEVQAAFQRCVGGGATCNCAVVVKAGDSVFVVDKCRTKELPGRVVPTAGPPCRSRRVQCTQFTKTEMYYHDKVTPGFRIFTRGDSAFEVLLPHGTRVLIRGGNWLNVYIYPSPSDWNNTEGLCGTYDGSARNDLTLRSGRLWRESLAHRSEPPLDFSLDWRVPENQLLMRGVAKQPYRLPVHCDCEAGSSADGGAPKALCSSSRILELCDFDSAGEITYKLPKGAQQTTIEQQQVNRVEPNRKRKREATEENVHDFDLNPDLPEVTQTGNWTKASAMEFCSKALLNDSTAVKNCRDHLSYFDPEFALESCAEDLMYSGDSGFVDAAAEVLKSQCAEQLAANVSFYNTVDGSDILLEVEESLCIVDCGQRGICLRGRCFCEDGYAGSACSVPLGEAPQSVALQNGGLCDQRRMNCSWSLVFGQTFVDTTNLTCRLQRVELRDNETGVVAGESVTTIGAVYISSQQLLCPITSSDGPTSYLISVSNDGATFSEQHLFLSRDVACYDCQWNASNVAICRRKENTCLVSGKCYTYGEESLEDPCLVCDPKETNTQLSRRTSTKCTDRTLLTVAIVVLAILFCAVVVFITFRLKRKEKRSIDQTPSSNPGKRTATSSKEVEKELHTPKSHDNVAMEEITD